MVQNYKMTAHDLDVDAIASMYGCDVKSEYRTQFEHRVNIVKAWNIPPGSRVLEIGPGQGDCTIVLAAAVGEHGYALLTVSYLKYSQRREPPAAAGT